MIWLAVAICMLLAFTFAGLEAGILSVPPVRLRHQRKRGDPAAVKLSSLLENRERLLVTVLLVTNLMNICAIVLATQEIVAFLGPAGYLAATLILLPLYLLGFELLPKSLFRRFPYRALAALIGLLRLTAFLLSPLVLALTGLGSFLLRRHEPEQRKLFAAREDFKYFAVESERVGAITKTEREMIHNIVDFRAVAVRDVMLPLEKAHTIRVDATMEELIALSRKTGIDRLPMTDASGRIAGVVNVFDTLLDLPSAAATPVAAAPKKMSQFRRRILTVQATDPAYTATRKLRAARAYVAVVVDENGAQLGIVTAEDLVKRLVSSAAA